MAPPDEHSRVEPGADFDYGAALDRMDRLREGIFSRATS
jgi:hypothetical protein